MASPRKTLQVPIADWNDLQAWMDAHSITSPGEGLRTLLRLAMAVENALFPSEYR